MCFRIYLLFLLMFAGIYAKDSINESSNDLSLSKDEVSNKEIIDKDKASNTNNVLDASHKSLSHDDNTTRKNSSQSQSEVSNTKVSTKPKQSKVPNTNSIESNLSITEMVEKQAKEAKARLEAKKELDKIPQIIDIDYRIHELQKEKYMLTSQLYYKEKQKRDWQANTARSGYYIGGGVMGDFVNSPNRDEGITTIRVNLTGIAKIGYIRYFNNDIGIKAEQFSLFHLESNVSSYYAGARFSLLHDVNLFGFNNHLGFIMGFGFGLGNLGGELHVGLNLHLGISLSFTKYIRIEIERLILNPLNPLSNELDFRNNYAVTLSFVI